MNIKHFSLAVLLSLIATACSPSAQKSTSLEPKGYVVTSIENLKMQENNKEIEGLSPLYEVVLAPIANTPTYKNVAVDIVEDQFNKPGSGMVCFRHGDQPDVAPEKMALRCWVNKEKAPAQIRTKLDANDQHWEDQKVS